MKIKGIVVAKDRGDTSLGITGTSLHGLLLGYYGHPTVLGHLQGERQACNPAPNDQKIDIILHGQFLRSPRHIV